jgi:hypothetical protein
LTQEELLWLLDEIGQSVVGTGGGLVLIGLGSVGAELARLDAGSNWRSMWPAFARS